MNLPKRTHSCGALRIESVGQEVTLNGWIQRRRDLGNLIFLDLRDRYGITQVAIDTSEKPELMEAGRELRPEFVVAVVGTVRPRPDDARNLSRATGEIEVACSSIRILNPSLVPPFEILDEIQVSDELRMRYRYMDMRRPLMQENLLLRHKVFMSIRNSLSDSGFIEVETPFLTKSTPEGARDYMVPSRVHKGRFYALPQSPQLFKQLLMVGGMDRYFQLVRCMRDEDLRADRQPEFTQLDLEMSFVGQEEVFEVMERVMEKALGAADRKPAAFPFPRMSHEEAVRRFGTDKPDTRFGMELFDLADVAAGCGFKVFKSVAESGGAVYGVTAPGSAHYSRKEIDALASFVAEYGAKGLAWFKVGEDGLSSPIAKFFAEDELALIRKTAGAGDGDLILIVAAPQKTARTALGELRVMMGRRLDLAGDELAFCWVTGFPMFEKDDETGELIPSHHPFTTPLEVYEGHLEKDPASVKACAYDLVLNGTELGSGSVRIHNSTLQARVFDALGIDKEDARKKFGFLLDAFEYGAPPHAGIALGMDRFVMLLAGMENIRDVIAFPKTATGSCPLTGAPSDPDPAMLKDLGLEMRSSS